MSEQRRKRSENDAMLPIPSPAAVPSRAEPPVPVDVRNSAPGGNVFLVSVDCPLVSARLRVEAASPAEAVARVVDSVRAGVTVRPEE